MGIQSSWPWHANSCLLPSNIKFLGVVRIPWQSQNQSQPARLRSGKNRGSGYLVLPLTTMYPSVHNKSGNMKFAIKSFQNHHKIDWWSDGPYIYYRSIQTFLNCPMSLAKWSFTIPKKRWITIEMRLFGTIPNLTLCWKWPYVNSAHLVGWFTYSKWCL